MSRPRGTRAGYAVVAVALGAGCGRPPLRTVSYNQLPRSFASYPRPADDERPPPPPVRHRDVTVVELRSEAARLVSIRVVFAAGSADDPPGREGLTQLTARAMVEGGTEALTYEELARRIFPMAARISFNVDRDMTTFEAQVHRDHIAAFYPLLRDVLLRPRLAEDDFRRVRAQSAAELTGELRGGDDEALARELLQSLIYADHPYGHPAVGTERGLEASSLADVRGHRARVFCRDRVAAGLAGAYPAELAAQLRHDLEQLPAACAPAVVLPTPSRPRNTHVVIVDKPSASSAAISIGHAVALTRADPDHAAVQLMTNYLGIHRQSSGVLFQTLRTARGLNYGDYAYAEHFAQQASQPFPRPSIQRRQQYASIWIRPVAPSAAHFALRAALSTTRRVLEQAMSDEDFERTRTFVGSFVSLYAQDDANRLGYAMDEWWLRASADGAAPGAPPTYAERVRAALAPLDREAVAAAARRHLSARDVWVAIVAPNAQALADAIGRNAPSPITYDAPKPPEVLAEDQTFAAFPLAVRPEDVRVVPVAQVFH